MSILINYKNSSYKRNSSSLVLFVDEKFNISPIRKHLSTHENSFVSDLIKAKDIKIAVKEVLGAEMIAENISI